jgi:hypothetical protein
MSADLVGRLILNDTLPLGKANEFLRLTIAMLQVPRAFLFLFFVVVLAFFFP